MKIFLFCLMLLFTGMLLLTIFSLEFSKLSSYGLGYLTGKVVLLLLCLTGVYFSGKSVFKKHFT